MLMRLLRRLFRRSPPARFVALKLFVPALELTGRLRLPGDRGNQR